VLGLAGFDWILLDGEHAPNDLGTFIPQLMALKDSPSAPVVRPTWNDTVMIKRLLDGGFHNFLIPFVESEDEAVEVANDTPYGLGSYVFTTDADQALRVADHLIATELK